MGLRRPVLVVVALLSAPGARASDHKADALFAGSYLDAPGSTIKLGGFHVAGAWVLPAYHPISFVGDFSVHFVGGEDEVEGTDPSQGDVTQTTLVAGLRWTPYGEKDGHRRPVMPFGHVLMGLVDRVGGSHLADTAFALVPGFGCDFAPGQNKNWGTRVQIDYIWPVSGDLSHSWRFSLGLLYRIRD